MPVAWFLDSANPESPIYNISLQNKTAKVEKLVCKLDEVNFAKAFSNDDGILVMFTGILPLKVLKGKVKSILRELKIDDRISAWIKEEVVVLEETSIVLVLSYYILKYVSFSEAVVDLKIQPQAKIVFNTPYHFKIGSSSARRIRWAMSITRMQRLGVDPACGVLDPKESVMVAVSCDAFGQEDTNNASPSSEPIRPTALRSVSTMLG